MDHTPSDEVPDALVEQLLPAIHHLLLKTLASCPLTVEAASSQVSKSPFSGVRLHDQDFTVIRQSALDYISSIFTRLGATKFPVTIFSLYTPQTIATAVGLALDKAYLKNLHVAIHRHNELASEDSQIPLDANPLTVMAVAALPKESRGLFLDVIDQKKYDLVQFFHAVDESVSKYLITWCMQYNIAVLPRAVNLHILFETLSQQSQLNGKVAYIEDLRSLLTMSHDAGSGGMSVYMAGLYTKLRAFSLNHPDVDWVDILIQMLCLKSMPESRLPFFQSALIQMAQDATTKPDSSWIGTDYPANAPVYAHVFHPNVAKCLDLPVSAVASVSVSASASASSSSSSSSSSKPAPARQLTYLPLPLFCSVVETAHKLELVAQTKQSEWHVSSVNGVRHMHIGSSASSSSTGVSSDDCSPAVKRHKRSASPPEARASQSSYSSPRVETSSYPSHRVETSSSPPRPISSSYVASSQHIIPKPITSPHNGCRRCGDTSPLHRWKSCNVPLHCTYCDQAGHVSFHCRACEICRQHGHPARDCNQRQKSPSGQSHGSSRVVNFASGSSSSSSSRSSSRRT